MRTNVVVLAVVVLAALAPAAHADDNSSDRLTFMTRNLYVGSSFSHIQNAADPIAFIQGATQIWANARATNFPRRAEALADEIAAEKPDLIGLQEVSLFRTQVPRDPTTPATTVAFDYLQILLDALAKRALSYRVATSLTGFDAEAPVFGGPTELIDVRLTDRDVVLVRSDVPGLQVTAAESHHYNAGVVLTTPVGPIPSPRGVNRVDVRFGNREFRMINTHLEPDVRAIQEAQARELVAGPLATGRTVIALGDFNSAADGSTTATYGILRDAGMVDAWNAVKAPPPGFTCCQAELLDNLVSLLDERIDLILTRGAAKTKSAVIVGDQPSDRVDGLWPSDHAGVVATIRLDKDE
jgi:endonuclease/exonuclease/phosphatase family metal-dependent hydrolase